MNKAVLLFQTAIAIPAIASAPAMAEPDLGFDVQVILSRKAGAELARRKESMIVGASYYGLPTSAAQHFVNEGGFIDLGQESIAIEGSDSSARVTGAKVDRDRLRWLSDQPMVNVNVYTARRSGPDNLIACDLIDGPVARLVSVKTVLHCGLISENRPTTVYPK